MPIQQWPNFILLLGGTEKSWGRGEPPQKYFIECNEKAVTVFNTHTTEFPLSISLGANQDSSTVY